MVTSSKTLIQRMVLIAIAVGVLHHLPRSAWALVDPGLLGPLAVSSQQYADQDITLPSFSGLVEQLAIVWHPTTMTRAYPLVVLLHGRHATCVQGTRAQKRC